MATTRRSFIKTVAGGTAAAAASVWAPRTARAATPVKVGCVVLGDFGINAPTMIGIEKGFFKQNDLEAEMVPFKGGPDLLKGVLAGAADIGLTGATVDVTELKEAEEQLARELALLVLNLDLRDTQRAAIALYEHLGYRRWGTHPVYAQVEGRVVPGHYYYKPIEDEPAAP